MREWLKEYRRASGKNQREVAEAAKVSQSYYAALERGIRGSRIAAPVAKRIAAALGFEWTRFYEEGAETEGGGKDVGGAGVS